MDCVLECLRPELIKLSSFVLDIFFLILHPEEIRKTKWICRKLEISIQQTKGFSKQKAHGMWEKYLQSTLFIRTLYFKYLTKETKFQREITQINKIIKGSRDV